MRDYDKLLDHSRKYQLMKLKENEHKEDWQHMTVKALYELAFAEWNEMSLELIDMIHNESNNFEEVQKEIADVQNFLSMMSQIIEGYKECANKSF